VRVPRVQVFLDPGARAPPEAAPEDVPDTRMRIAYLTADFGIPVLGTKGASAHVRGLVNALMAEGHEVFVLASNIGEESSESFPLRHVPVGTTLAEVFDALQKEELCRGTRLAKDLRNVLYSLSLEMQGRLLLEDFAPDLIYERHCLFATAGRELSRYFGVPLILEVNAPLVLEQQKMRGLSLPLVARTAERLVLESADHVVVVSEMLRRYLAGLGVPADRLSVIPNAADPDLFRPAAGRSAIRRALGWDRCCVIGFVGSMKPWHGVEILIEVLGRLGGAASPYRLLLVGAGPQLELLQTMVTRMGLGDAVHTPGAVSHGRIPEFLHAMDLAVAPYAADADEYFSPVKLFEYMAAGLPVVAARLGQVSDVIEPGRTGWLYTPGDAGELVSLIERLATDRALARRAGAAAREQVVSDFSWRLNARRVLAIAERLCARRHGEPGEGVRSRQASLESPQLQPAE
jgi:glycosyltransferase involved in cell wall biosynthesis